MQKPVHATVAISVGAYILTSGVAALIPFHFGQEQLRQHFYPSPVPFDWMTTLGSPTYWLLFLLVLTALPIAAYASASVTTKFTREIKVDVPLWVPLSIAGAMIAFCTFKLWQAGGLSAREAWDSNVCYDQTIIRRVELFSLLGFKFYSVVYSGLPIVGCYLLARGLREHRWGVLLCWAAMSLAIVWIDIATIQKAPVLVYFIMVGLTLLFSGFGLVRSALITGACGLAMYLLLSHLQFCSQQQKPWDIRAPSPQNQVATPANTDSASLPERAFSMARSAAFRMAAGFPYYVQIFSDPAERCGINAPRWMWSTRCFAPTKAFAVVYPHITYTTGAYPAPVNVSGYAEAGLAFAIFATILAGAILGGMSAAARGSSPIAITMQVACCVYAYFITQSSLTGSIIDSYGLVWLITPVAVMAAAGFATAIAGSSNASERLYVKQRE